MSVKLIVKAITKERRIKKKKKLKRKSSDTNFTSHNETISKRWQYGNGERDILLMVTLIIVISFIIIFTTNIFLLKSYVMLKSGFLRAFIDWLNGNHNFFCKLQNGLVYRFFRYYHYGMEVKNWYSFPKRWMILSKL